MLRIANKNINKNKCLFKIYGRRTGRKTKKVREKA